MYNLAYFTERRTTQSEMSNLTMVSTYAEAG